MAPRRRNGAGAFAGAFFIWTLLILAFWTAVIWIGVHFIRKWW